MRRMEREGVSQGDFQRRINERLWNDPRCKEDDRGWVQPFANWQGWDELNHAIYALRCVMLFKRVALPPAAPIFREDATLDRGELYRGSTLARIESDMRSFHFHIARSRRCERPALP